MVKIMKYSQYKRSYIMAEELIDRILNPIINESNDNIDFNGILKGLSKDLRFNFSLVLTFGTGIKVMFPIVNNLIKNSTLNVEASTDNIILLSIAALAIVYLEEKNNKTSDDNIGCEECDGSGVVDETDIECSLCNGTGYIKSEVSKSDIKTILEELKLRGFGNGIVKKVVSCLKSIGNLFKTIFKNTPYIISGILDMFAYTTLLIPSMNAIDWMIGKYDFNIETLPMNFLSVGIGVVTFLAKSGFNYLVDKLKNKLNIKINPDLGDPIITRTFDIKDGDGTYTDKKTLIKEQ